MKLEPIHIIILLLLVVILVVVAKISRNQKTGKRSFSNLRNTLRSEMPSVGDMKKTLGLSEGYSLSAGQEADLLKQQYEQQKFAFGFNFPKNTVFQQLDDMAKTCETETSIPQCQLFNKYYDGLLSLRADLLARRV